MSISRLALILIALLLVPANAWAATVTLSPSKDNTIFESPSSNSGGGAAGIFVGTNNGPSKRRGLIAFDVASSVPAGSTITGVELSMYLANSPNTNNQTIGLHRLNLDWGENQNDTTSAAVNGAGNGVAAVAPDATWIDNFFGTSSWPTPGATGSFNAVASGTAVIGGAIDNQHKWLSTLGLVGDVQSWLNNPATNFGWALVNANESSTQTFKAFYSQQAKLNAGGTGSTINPAWKPLLTITFIPEPSTTLLSLVALTLAACIRRQ